MSWSLDTVSQQNIHSRQALSPFWRVQVSKWKKSAWYNFLFSAVYLFVSVITSGIISPQEKANYDINWIENDKLKGLLCMPVSANWISEKTENVTLQTETLNIKNKYNQHYHDKFHRHNHWKLYMECYFVLNSANI